MGLLGKSIDYLSVRNIHLAPYRIGTKVDSVPCLAIRISQPGTAEPNMQQPHRIEHRFHLGAKACRPLVLRFRFGGFVCL